jgi:hypothetical protein
VGLAEGGGNPLKEDALACQRPGSFRHRGAAFAEGGGDRYERLRPGYPDDAVTFESADADAGIASYGASWVVRLVSRP